MHEQRSEHGAGSVQAFGTNMVAVVKRILLARMILAKTIEIHGPLVTKLEAFHVRRNVRINLTLEYLFDIARVGLKPISRGICRCGHGGIFKRASRIFLRHVQGPFVVGASQRSP